jgi:hypothetical protein
VRARLLATGLLLASALTGIFAARPWRQETLGLGDEYRRLRDERRRVEARTGSLMRAGAIRQRTLVTLASSRGRTLPNTRRAALQCLAQVDLGEVKLGVRLAKLGSAEGVAQVHILGAGSFAEVVKLTGQLASGPGGFLLDQVTFTPRGERVGFAIEAYGLGGAP